MRNSVDRHGETDLTQRPHPSGPFEEQSLLEMIDWSVTPLGPRTDWPACLHSALDIMMPAQAQIVLFWGPQFIAFYNEAYAPTIGDKHPHAFGRPAREYWGELWDDLEPLLRRVLDHGETVMAKDRPFYIERFGFPETVYFDISYSPVRDERRVTRGVFCIVNETTERIKADAALRGNEERLRAIFSQSAAGIALGDLSGRLLSVNQHYCEIVGRTADELVGTRMQDTIYKDDRPESIRLLQRLAKTGENFDIEERYVRKDGSLVWVANSVSPIKDEQGNIFQAVAISVDITERKRIHDVERHLAAMIASSNDAILGINLDMTITSWNSSASRLYGYSQDEAIGRSVLMLVPDDRKEEEPVILKQIGAGLVVEPYETKRRRKDGQLVDVLLSVSPILDAAGRVVGASKTAHDISARKEAERLQEILTNELNHRVKNLLATVIAIARQTLGNAATRADVDAFGARLVALGRAQDLLIHGKWQMAYLHSMVEEAIAPYSRSRFQLDGPSVQLPPKAVMSFSMALHELATNAVKYGSLSGDEGKVAISWSRRLDGEDRLTLEWRESGGPEVHPPATKGFGSRLLERLLAAELNGHSEIRYEPTGLVCVITADLAHTQFETSSEAHLGVGQADWHADRPGNVNRQARAEEKTMER